MMKYRVETNFECLSDGSKWGPQIVEFDTEVDSHWLVQDRLRSIGAVILRMIGEREGLQNPNSYPMAAKISGAELNDSLKDLLEKAI